MADMIPISYFFRQPPIQNGDPVRPLVFGSGGYTRWLFMPSLPELDETWEYLEASGFRRL